MGPAFYPGHSAPAQVRSFTGSRAGLGFPGRARPSACYDRPFTALRWRSQQQARANADVHVKALPNFAATVLFFSGLDGREPPDSRKRSLVTWPQSTDAILRASERKPASVG